MPLLLFFVFLGSKRQAPLPSAFLSKLLPSSSKIIVPCFKTLGMTSPLFPIYLTVVLTIWCSIVSFTYEGGGTGVILTQVLAKEFQVLFSRKDSSLYPFPHDLMSFAPSRSLLRGLHSQHVIWTLIEMLTQALRRGS